MRVSHTFRLAPALAALALPTVSACADFRAETTKPATEHAATEVVGRPAFGTAGDRLGTVERVGLDAAGRPVTVSVVSGGLRPPGRSVVVSADGVLISTMRNEAIVTRMTEDVFAALAGVAPGAVVPGGALAGAGGEATDWRGSGSGR